VVWLRPAEIVSAPRLFGEGGPNGSDVVGGQLGDRWFLGALAVVAEHISLLRQIFTSSCAVPAAASREHAMSDFKLPTSGLISFRFWKLGQWQEVVIDDRLPCDARTRRPLYAHSKRPEVMWVSLVEKAYAKLLGGTPQHPLPA
jgi:hypothetical protein